MQSNHVKQNFDENNQPVNERITERIANHYELRLMRNPPEADKKFEHPTTIIAPEGAYQWNKEIEQWTSRITTEKFTTDYQELSFLLQSAIDIMNPEGESAYAILTLKQLNNLDQALRVHHGYTIIGYSICEEIYLRELNFIVWPFCKSFSEYDYPPLPEAYSKRLLIFVSQPLVLDIAASLRVATQTVLLFWLCLIAYFQYTPQSHDDYLQFYDNNTPWILLSLNCIIVLYSGSRNSDHFHGVVKI